MGTCGPTELWNGSDTGNSFSVTLAWIKNASAPSCWQTKFILENLGGKCWWTHICPSGTTAQPPELWGLKYQTPLFGCCYRKGGKGCWCWNFWEVGKFASKWLLIIKTAGKRQISVWIGMPGCQMLWWWFLQPDGLGFTWVLGINKLAELQWVGSKPHPHEQQSLKNFCLVFGPVLP